MKQCVHGTFVSEKINKIRWCPDFMNHCTSFVTGSWGNHQNTIKLWRLEENLDESDMYPVLISQYNHQGDVTELKFIDTENFIASSSSGSVTSYHASSRAEITDQVITASISWLEIHRNSNHKPSPCTGISIYDQDIVSVGEDGTVNFFNSQNSNILHSIPNADSCSIRCVTFLKHAEILTGNLRGQLKIWDIRCDLPKSVNIFKHMLSAEQVSLTSLQCHPTQRHLIVAGDEDGSITIWDLRKNVHPINVLKSHNGPISEIHFHPDYTDHLFSASGAGDILQWSPKVTSSAFKQNIDNNSWLNADAIQSKLDVFTLMPKLHKSINSFDLNQSNIISGCDNEAIYLINEVNVFNSG